jgi:hypothetical protein
VRLGLPNLRRSGQAKRVTVPCAAQWATHSTCLNDQLEVKVQRIVTARPMVTVAAVASRPPHGSRHALRTHRALPSGSGVETVTGQPLSVTSMSPRVGVGGLQAFTATYFAPSVTYGFRDLKRSDNIAAQRCNCCGS